MSPRLSSSPSSPPTFLAVAKELRLRIYDFVFGDVAFIELFGELNIPDTAGYHFWSTPKYSHALLFVNKQIRDEAISRVHTHPLRYVVADTNNELALLPPFLRRRICCIETQLDLRYALQPQRLRTMLTDPICSRLKSIEFTTGVQTLLLPSNQCDQFIQMMDQGASQIPIANSDDDLAWYSPLMVMFTDDLTQYNLLDTIIDKCAAGTLSIEIRVRLARAEMIENTYLAKFVSH